MLNETKPDASIWWSWFPSKPIRARIAPSAGLPIQAAPGDRHRERNSSAQVFFRDQPEKLLELRLLFYIECAKYNVLPLAQHIQ